MHKVQLPWQLALTLFLTIFMWTPQVAYAQAQTDGAQADGELVRLMVKVDPVAAASADFSAFSTATTAVNVNSSLPQLGWQVIEVDAAAADDVLSALQARQGIIEVTPDYPLELSWSPNDPGFTQGSQWALDKIGADVAWEFSTGESVTVAVLDSGIDPNHPDLAGRVLPGYNFIDKNDDTTDLCGHGTHVSGIIAAETNNSVGVASVAPHAMIMPLKVINDNCAGSYSRLMEAIIYAVDQGVRIISITSGGGFDHSGLHDALIYARDHGVLVVVAAGNRANDLGFYPGSYAESFTIAGTDENDQKYNNSNFGKQVDMSAPATAVYNTYYDKNVGSTYAYMTGTSMAAPHVAGVAALVLAIDPKLPLADLEAALINSATDLGPQGWDQHFGWGRLTAWRAVAAVSPLAGNVRTGHFRVPKLATLDITDIKAVTAEGSIQLRWTQPSYAAGQNADHSVVIYRSVVPVFEAATDIAKIAATAAGEYDDTSVEIDQEYYYWLVQADNDVEVAITQVVNAKFSNISQQPKPVQLEPKQPEPNQPEPEQPKPDQPAQAALFMPLLER